MIWPQVRLSRKARTISGSGFPPAEQGLSEGDLPFLKVRDLSGPSAQQGLVSAANWVTTATANSLGVRRIPAGSTVFPKVGAALLNNARAFLLVPAVADNNVMAVFPTEGYPRYWYWVLQTVDMGMLSDGGTLPFISDSDVRALQVPYPPLDEQRRIADFLDDQVALLDRALEGRGRQVRLEEERHEATWTAAMLETPRSLWHPLRRFLLSIIDGPFGSSLTSAHYTNEGARVVRLGNIGLASFRHDDKAFISDDYFDVLRVHAVKAGDLLIAGLGDERHPLGRACVAPDQLGKCIVKADCYRVRLDERRLAHDYAALAISSPVVTSQTVTLSRGSTRARINTEIAREIRIPVPERSVQIRLVTLLRESSTYRDRVAELITSQSSLLIERRQALITAAVTGQFDVTTARSVA